MKITLGAAALMLALASGLPADGQQPSRDPSPPKVISSHEIEGRFLGYCEGDYLHVGFRPKEGQAKWLFLWDQSPRHIAYFLATRRGEWMRVRYEVTDAYIWEARSRQVIEVLADAATGETSYREWYAREGSSIFGDTAEKFEKLVRSQFVDCSGKSGQP